MPQPIAAAIEGNPDEPGAHCASNIEAFERTMGGDERVLDCVKRIVWIGEASQGEAVQAVAMTPHDFREGIIAPSAAENGKLTVGK